MAAWTWSGFVTSMASDTPPSTCADASMAPSPSTSVKTTWLPLAARRLAMACPMPRAAPVTRLTLPLRSHCMEISLLRLAFAERGRRFDRFHQILQEPGRRRSVHDAVIERQAQCNLFAADAADAENRGFRVVDDRRERVDAEHTEIRDGENAALK